MTKRDPDGGLGGAGLIGAGAALALCCLAPILIATVGAAAISGWLAWLGYGGLAAVALALGLLACALWRLRRRGGAAASPERRPIVER